MNGVALWAILTGAGIVWAFYYFGIIRFGLGEDEPVIAANGLATSTTTSMHQGQLGDYLYNLLTNATGRVIVLVTLPKNSKLHIVAIGDKSGLDNRLTPGRLSHLERMVLEGDFPSYFKMYCNRGRETELLRIFDPADMARFVDFCRAYDFELIHDAIYISQAAGARDKDDETTMMKDIETFLAKNHHVLKRLGVE